MSDAGGGIHAVGEIALRTATLGSVRDAYAAWAPVYIDRFGSADKASDEDRALLARWAATLDGPVLDAGCGPGHWSAFLRSSGLEVEGVDATREFVDHATREHPALRFHVGDLRDLGLAPRSLGGVLAWFSLIHADPDEVPGILEGFAGALQPGGGLLLGYFAGTSLRTFDHRVVTAWAWPTARMSAAVEAAGLEVLDTEEHPGPNGRIGAHLLARRAD